MTEIVEKETASGFVDRFVWKGLRFTRVATRSPSETSRYEGEDILYGGLLESYPNGQWMALFTLGLGCYGWSKEEALQGALRKHIEHLYYLVAKLEAVDFGEVW